MGGGKLFHEHIFLFDYYVETHHGASLQGHKKAEYWRINASKQTLALSCTKRNEIASPAVAGSQ